MPQSVFRFALLAAVAILASAHPALAQPGDKPDNRAQTLEFIRDQIRANYAKIKTIQGVYKFSDRTLHTIREPRGGDPVSRARNDRLREVYDVQDESYWRKRNAVAPFVLDVANDRLFCKHLQPWNEEDLFVYYQSGGVVRIQERKPERPFHEYRAVLTSKLVIFHDMDARTSVRGASRRRLVQNGRHRFPPSGGLILIGRPTTGSSRLAHEKVADPRGFWSNGFRRFDDWCESYADAFHGKSLDHDRQHTIDNLESERTRVDEVTQYTITVYQPVEGNPRDAFYSRTTFSSEHGFHPISHYRVTNGIVYYRRDFEYRVIDGITIPTRMNTAFTHRRHPGATPDQFRSVELQRIQLNELVDEEQFQLTAFRLRPGDFVDNDIEGKAYKVGEDRELLPLE